MRKRTTGQIPNVDIFAPAEFSVADFVVGIDLLLQKIPLAPLLCGGCVEALLGSHKTLPMPGYIV